MLTRDAAIPFLIGRGLLGASAVVDSRLTVHDLSRRNRNFAVRHPDGSGYLLKQAVNQDPSLPSYHTVRYEADVYELLSRMRGAGRMRRHIVNHLGFDQQTGVLLIELMPVFRQIRRQYFHRAVFPRWHARQFAEALTHLHLTPLDEPRRLGIEIAPSPAPAIFQYGCPDLDSVAALSAGSQQLLHIVRGMPRFAEHLGRLREEWTVDGIIHSDIKFENWALAKERHASRAWSIKLIDWETTGWGDTCWDLGSVLGDYLVFWVLTMPMSGATPALAAIESTRFPLERMHPALKEFWDCYARGTSQRPWDNTPRLRKATRFAGARLLQAAVELMQTSGQLTGAAVCLCQVSFNILDRPDDAVEHLLGLA